MHVAEACKHAHAHMCMASHGSIICVYEYVSWGPCEICIRQMNNRFTMQSTPPLNNTPRLACSDEADRAIDCRKQRKPEYV